MTQKATRREWIGLFVLLLAALVYAMDLTVLNLAIPRMSEELKPSSVELLWIFDIYGFPVAGLLITMGTLGDRIGRRKLLLFGAAGFALSSLVAAFSTTPTMLIGARALMGIFGATVAPSTLSLIFTMFQDTRQRSAAIGLWIAAYSAGSAVGPIAGGVLLEFFWWGSVFLIGVPVMGLLLLLGPRSLPEYRDENARGLDLPSAAMSLIAILAVVLGLKLIAQDGLSMTALVAIVVGVLLGYLFVRRQLTLESPIIDVKLFRIREFSASLLSYFLAIFVVVGYFLLISQYLQLVLGLSPFAAALWELPSAIGFAVGSITATRYIHKVRPSLIMGGGMAIAGLGAIFLLFLTVEGSSNLLLVAAASVVMSVALSPVITLGTELIVGSAPPEQAGAATGISETSGELGGALGIAILGSLATAIYRSDVTAGLPADLPAAVVAAARDTLGGAIAVAAELPAAAAMVVTAVASNAFVNAIHIVAAVSLVGALATAVVAALALRTVQARGDAPRDAES